MSRQHSADVVVIGGGIIGCACAYYLTAARLRVLLLERDGIAGATSGSCMGHLMVVPKPAEMWALSRASVRLWRDLDAALGGFELNPTGCLWLAEEPQDLELLTQVLAQYAGLGDTATMLDAAALRALEPGLAQDLPGAVFYPHDAVVSPMKAAGMLLRAAIARGCEVRTHAPVTAIERDVHGAVAAVVTPRGRIATPAVVNATGVWAPHLAAMVDVEGLPVFPRRGDLAITAPRECPVRHQLIEVGYLRTTTTGAVDPESSQPDPGAQAMNLQPQTHGTCLIGSTRQFGGYERKVNLPLLQRSLARASRFCPSLTGARIVRTWAGLRPYTKDKLPILGPVPEVPGLLLATGHEGLGITLAPITGLLITQVLTGATPDLDLTPFMMSRFELRASHA